MICIAFTLISMIDFGTCAEVGVVPMEAALKSGSLFDVDELVEIIRERLNITTLNAEIAANKHGVAANKHGVAANKHGVAANKKEISAKAKDISTIKTDIINLRSDLTHCVTGWGSAWAIKDGSWLSKKISFKKSFSKEPQVMVAVMGAGKWRSHDYCGNDGQAIDFDIAESVKVSKSSFTIRVMTKGGEKSCSSLSYVYFSYIACGTY